jgi:hypothetical protein
VGKSWLLTACLIGGCATQQALRETDQRMDELALRIAAVENTTQRSSGTQPQARAQPEASAKLQAETIAKLQAELATTRAELAATRAELAATRDRIGKLEANEARLTGLEARAGNIDQQLALLQQDAAARLAESIKLEARVVALEESSARPGLPRSATPRTSQPAPLAKPVDPRERERRLEDAAKTAVLKHCSRSVVWAWRTMKEMSATYVPPMGGRTFELVNVSAKLDHPATNGHTLWYEIHFNGEVPSEIKPLKDISGELCRLPADGMKLSGS